MESIRGGANDSKAIVFNAGNTPPPYKVQKEFWNGTTWTEIADMR